MLIIIGLGNPDKKYKKTRHNVGFRIIDEFAEINSFPEFVLSKKFNSLISEGVFNDKKIILAKPQTFMNRSGKTAKTLIAFYKTKKSELIVIHDDIDLPLGKIKIQENRGAAGHKGIQSIINEIKTKNFIRFRIGIKPSTATKIPTEKFVLEKFLKKEEEILKKTIKYTCEATEMTINQNAGDAMNEFNQ